MRRCVALHRALGTRGVSELERDDFMSEYFDMAVPSPSANRTQRSIDDIVDEEVATLQASAARATATSLAVAVATLPSSASSFNQLGNPLSRRDGEDVDRLLRQWKSFAVKVSTVSSRTLRQCRASVLCQIFTAFAELELPQLYLSSSFPAGESLSSQGGDTSSNVELRALAANTMDQSP